MTTSLRFRTMKTIEFVFAWAVRLTLTWGVAVFGFAFFIGSVGAYEFGNISYLQAVAQTIAGAGALFLAGKSFDYFT